jgi:hypothetical protein
MDMYVKHVVMSSPWMGEILAALAVLRSLSRACGGGLGRGAGSADALVEGIDFPPPAALFERVDLPRTRER